ncbi:MAG: kinase [Alcaligenaceae bacterium]|nr:MAG: kinase [Alcaligenaceae bacterium]
MAHLYAAVARAVAVSTQKVIEPPHEGHAVAEQVIGNQALAPEARWPKATDRYASLGHAPATFGELIQGREPVSGRDFLVTFPITLGSTVKFCGFHNSSRLYVFPLRKQKSIKAARLFLQRFQIPTGGILQVCSNVPEGKGLASSSADVVATLRALAQYFEQELTIDEMCSIIRQIEPTDGVMFDESVAFFHRCVELGQVIGKLPRLCVLAIDEGGIVDTVTYNTTRFDFAPEELHKYGELLADVIEGISRKNLRQIGFAATTSSRLHQSRNPKKTLEQLEGLVEAVGAIGIVNCHSGTCIGLCFDARAPESLDNISRAGRLLGATLQQDLHKFFTK